MRLLPSGICLTQTAIFMRGGLYSGVTEAETLGTVRSFEREPERPFS